MRSVPRVYIYIYIYMWPVCVVSLRIEERVVKWANLDPGLCLCLMVKHHKLERPANHRDFRELKSDDGYLAAAAASAFLSSSSKRMIFE